MNKKSFEAWVEKFSAIKELISMEQLDHNVINSVKLLKSHDPIVLLEGSVDNTIYLEFDRYELQKTKPGTYNCIMDAVSYFMIQKNFVKLTNIIIMIKCPGTEQFDITIYAISPELRYSFRLLLLAHTRLKEALSGKLSPDDRELSIIQREPALEPILNRLTELQAPYEFFFLKKGLLNRPLNFILKKKNDDEQNERIYVKFRYQNGLVDLKECVNKADLGYITVGEALFEWYGTDVDVEYTIVCELNTSKMLTTFGVSKFKKDEVYNYLESKFEIAKNTVKNKLKTN